MKKIGLILLGSLLLAGCTAGMNTGVGPTPSTTTENKTVVNPVVSPTGAKEVTGISDKNDEDTIKKELDSTNIETDFSKMVKP